MRNNAFSGKYEGWISGFQVGRVFVANATPQMCMCVSVKMLRMMLLMCIFYNKAVSPAHMETANPPRELL